MKNLQLYIIQYCSKLDLKQLNIARTQLRFRDPLLKDG